MFYFYVKVNIQILTVILNVCIVYVIDIMQIRYNGSDMNIWLLILYIYTVKDVRNVVEVGS